MRVSSHLLEALLVACSACASAPRGPADSRPGLTLSGLAAASRTVATPTASAALDRIGKRAPILDGTSVHAGTGRGVLVYVFDGGVRPDEPELAGRVRAGYDAYPSLPRACNAHGTAVAAAAAGRSLGVAPEADVVDVKVFDCATGHGASSAILAAARWAAADHALHPDRPAVANWSFVTDTMGVIKDVARALAVLRDAGILVVAAAGNYDIDACRVSPANSRLALIVGASALSHDGDGRTADVRVKGTAWGHCVDVYAPGDSVLLPNATNSGAPVSYWRGTSMAAGYVSGEAALILEQYPAASTRDLARTLLQRATPDVVDQGAPTAARGRMLYVGPLP